MIITPQKKSGPCKPSSLSMPVRLAWVLAIQFAGSQPRLPSSCQAQMKPKFVCRSAPVGKVWVKHEMGRWRVVALVGFQLSPIQ